MTVTDQEASRIAKLVFDRAEKNGIQHWALSPSVLVRESIEEWEKSKRAKDDGSKGQESSAAIQEQLANTIKMFLGVYESEGWVGEHEAVEAKSTLDRLGLWRRR